MRKILKRLLQSAFLLLLVCGYLEAHDNAGIKNTSPRSRFDRTAAPTVNDGSNKGFKPASLWLDITNNKEYVCLDSTVGAAVWIETTEFPGGINTYVQFNNNSDFGGDAGFTYNATTDVVSLEEIDSADGADIVINPTTTTSFSDKNIVNVGDIALDSISSDAGTTITVTLGTDAGDDLKINNGGDILLIEGDTNLSTFTGNALISKADPEIKLTDTGDSSNTRWTRTDTSAQANMYNTVNQPGGLGNALDFDGVNDNVTFTDTSDFDFGTGDFAISFWIKWSVAGSEVNFIFGDVPSTTGIGSWGIFHLKTAATWRMIFNNNDNKLIGSWTRDLNWNHIVFNRVSGTISGYVNNSSIGSVGMGNINIGDRIWVMGSGAASLAHAPVKIDEFAIWSTSLSVNDIGDLYNSGAGLSIDKDMNFPTDGGSMGTNLEALWHHDEAAMNQAPGGLDTEDSSDNDNHGTAEASMTDSDFVPGLILIAGADQEANVWQSEDGTGAFERGKQTYGDQLGRTVVDGRTIRFCIGGSEKAQIDANGTLIIDNGVDTVQALILKAAVSASENIFETRDSSGNIQISFDPDGGAIFNEEGNDSDTRVEGNTEDKLLLVDAGNDEVRAGDGDTNYFTTDKNGDSWWVGGGGLIFGHMYVDGTQAIVVAITQNVPAEVEDDGTTSAEDGWLAGELNLVTFPAGGTEHYLTVPKAGMYRVTWDMSFSMAAPGATVEIHGGVMVDDTAVRAKGEAHRTIPNTTASGNMGGTMVIDATAGTEEVSLWILNSTNNNDITVEHGNVYLELVGGT